MTSFFNVLLYFGGNCKRRLELHESCFWISDTANKILKLILVLYFFGTTMPRAFRNCYRDFTHSQFVWVDGSWRRERGWECDGGRTEGGGWRRGVPLTSLSRSLIQFEPSKCWELTSLGAVIFFDRYLWQQLQVPPSSVPLFWWQTWLLG